MHNPKIRYRQLKSVLTKAKTIEDLLPASVYFTIKSVHSLNKKKQSLLSWSHRSAVLILRIMTLRTGTQELLKNYLVRERVKFV